MQYDYLVYEELERMRRAEMERDERPRLELPLYLPYWPESKEKESEDEYESEQGVIIIQM